MKTFHWAMRLHQKLAFSSFFCGVSPSPQGKVKRIFFPGCSLSSYSPTHVTAVFKYLEDRLDGVGALLSCCGKPLKMMGATDEHRHRFDGTMRELRKTGATELVVACPSCSNAFSSLKDGFAVRSLWSLMEEHGLPEDVLGLHQGLTVSLQDSCVLRGAPEVGASVRRLLSAMGVTVLEMSSERAKCCGYARLIASGDKKEGLRAMCDRAAESPCDTVVTYCAACRTSMTLGGRQSLHLLDLIFGARGVFAPGVQGTLQSWYNRWRTRRLLAGSARYRRD